MDWIGLDWIGGLTDCMGRHTKEGEIQQAEQQLLQMIDKIMLKKKKMLGSLYIMQNHVCFHGKVFGKSTRILIPGNTISEVIKRDDNTLLVNHFRVRSPQSITSSRACLAHGGHQTPGRSA